MKGSTTVTIIGPVREWYDGGRLYKEYKSSQGGGYIFSQESRGEAAPGFGMPVEMQNREFFPGDTCSKSDT